MLFHTVAVAIGILFFFPIFWMIELSVKTPISAFELPPVYWGFTLDFTTYTQAFGGAQTIVGGSALLMGRYLVNAILISVANTFLVMVLAVPAAYSFARHDFRMKRGLFFWFITFRMLPAVAVIVPVYLMMKSLNLLDTHVGLILMYCTFNLPYAVWLMKGFFESIPRDIDESAMLDGCSFFGIITKILLPIAKPGIAATTFFCFIFAWNELLLALVIGGSETTKLLAAVASLASYQLHVYEWPTVGAMTVLYMLPPLLVSIVFRRYLLRGLAVGAVKG